MEKSNRNVSSFEHIKQLLTQVVNKKWKGPKECK